MNLLATCAFGMKGGIAPPVGGRRAGACNVLPFCFTEESIRPARRSRQPLRILLCLLPEDTAGELPAKPPFHGSGLKAAPLFNKAGVPLVEAHGQERNGEAPQAHLMLWSFVWRAPELLRARPHQKLSGRDDHHFRATLALAEMDQRSQRRLLISR